MDIYLYRILSENNEAFSRDILIRSDQTLFDLHTEILKCTKLNATQLSSFYFVNEEMEKLAEFTLLDMFFQDSDDDENAAEANPIDVRPMAEVRIEEVFNSEEEMLVYEYDFLNPIILYARFIEVVDIEKKLEYPLCIRSKSVLKREVKSVSDEVETLLAGFDEIVDFRDEYIPDSMEGEF